MSLVALPLVLLAALLWVAALVLSIAALVQIHRSRGRYTGTWLAVTTLVSCCVMFLLVPRFALSARPGLPAPERRITPATAPMIRSASRPKAVVIGPNESYGLNDAWPKKSELRDLFTMDSPPESEGREALRWAGLPGGVLDDLTTARRATFLMGQVELLGFEFRTAIARRRWENTPSFAALLPEDSPPDRDTELKSLSFFILRYVESPELGAAIEGLTRMLEGKIQFAIELERLRRR